MSLIVEIRKNLGGFVLYAAFEAENGITSLLGPSGCGKSMTLKSIAGIVTPDEGRIVLNGRILFDSAKKINLPPQKRKVGYLFQSYALFPHMDVRGNIGYGLKIKGRKKAEIREAMEEYYDFDLTVDGYRTQWEGHGREICQIAVPQALVCFFEGENFEDVIRNCISIGGDSDTIGCITGSIAEAFFGVPVELRERAMSYLPKGFKAVISEFENKYGYR